MPIERKGYSALAGLLVFAMAAVAGAAPAYAQQWAQTYGGARDEKGYAVRQTSDGGYVVAGKTESFGAGQDDVWVLKLDASGAIQWQRTYGGAGLEEAYSIQQTSDGGYIAAGATSSFGAGDFDVWVLKLDSGGAIQWERAYGGPGWDEARAIQQTSDGGYIVAGWTLSFGAGDGDFWVLKLDASGAIQWQRTYGGPADDRARPIQQTSDGGYIVAGSTSSFGAGGKDVWVLKLDADGEIEWQRTYGGRGDDRARFIQQSSDGGYVLTGRTKSFGAGDYDVWVVKLDASGAIQWQKAYGGPDADRARFIQQSSDGGYVVAGVTFSFGAGDGDAWLLKLDGDGDIQWEKTYGGTSLDWGRFVQQTSDGGYVLMAWVSSFGAGHSDFWVLKLDRDGAIPGCSVIGTSSATVTNTNATVITTTVTPADSASGSPGTNATVTSTTVLPAQVCSDRAADIQGSVAIGGAPVVGAEVTLQNKVTGARAKTTTDATGSYRFDPVAAGRHRITVKPLAVPTATTVSGTLQVQGLPSVGTTVRLKNLGSGGKASTTTDIGGDFSFAEVLAGTYKLVIPTVRVP